MARITKASPAKLNLLLNILGRRADGFHELETVMYPVPIHDHIEVDEGPTGIELTCSDPALPCDRQNLVYRAAELFLTAAGVKRGVRVHLEKRLPMGAGIGGGSGNAATTLLACNEAFGRPLPLDTLDQLAAQLGSDVPFFLYNEPCIATGRGEKVQRLGKFPALAGKHVVLVHPGFGVPTPWAYGQIAKHPELVSGTPGRAARLASLLKGCDFRIAASEFFNAFELPVFKKYPLLALLREFLETAGALSGRMSGSGSAIFGITHDAQTATTLLEKVRGKFGECWTATAPL